MKKSEIHKQLGGWKIGESIEVVDGPEKGTVITIIKVGLKDDDGFPAVEITYSSGEVEITAEIILNDALDNKYEHSVKLI